MNPAERFFNNVIRGMVIVAIPSGLLCAFRALRTLERIAEALAK